MRVFIVRIVGRVSVPVWGTLPRPPVVIYKSDEARVYPVFNWWECCIRFCLWCISMTVYTLCNWAALKRGPDESFVIGSATNLESIGKVLPGGGNRNLSKLIAETGCSVGCAYFCSRIVIAVVMHLTFGPFLSCTVSYFWCSTILYSIKQKCQLSEQLTTYRFWRFSIFWLGCRPLVSIRAVLIKWFVFCLLSHVCYALTTRM